jgi:hypothetical protein
LPRSADQEINANASKSELQTAIVIQRVIDGDMRAALRRKILGCGYLLLTPLQSRCG